MASRSHSSPSAAPLDEEDLLCEILLRLPPQPSSLPRASAVCKRWRRLLSDPRFLHRFRRHHRRNPPLLGCFINKSDGIVFLPATEGPDRVPPGRFSLHLDPRVLVQSMGCRHGLVLISDRTRNQLIVWDPITGDRQQLAIPPGFDPKTAEVKGTVLRAADGVHFQVALVQIGSQGTQHGKRAIACIYSSKTGEWGNFVSTTIPFVLVTLSKLVIDYFGIRAPTVPSVLVGDSLYWKITGSSSSILELDLVKQSLAMIQVPVDVFYGGRNFMVMRADGGGLGLLIISNFTAQLWERKTDCDGVASWVLGRSIELDTLLSLSSEKISPMLLGFAEENNVVILGTTMGLFEVHLQSLQFKILSKTNLMSQYHPFESVYTAKIGGEHDGAEHLHNA